MFQLDAVNTRLAGETSPSPVLELDSGMVTVAGVAGWLVRCTRKVAGVPFSRVLFEIDVTLKFALSLSVIVRVAGEAMIVSFAFGVRVTMRVSEFSATRASTMFTGMLTDDWPIGTVTETGRVP